MGQWPWNGICISKWQINDNTFLQETGLLIILCLNLDHDSVGKNESPKFPFNKIQNMYKVI